MTRTRKNIGIAATPKAEIQHLRKGPVPTRAEVLTFWGGYDHSSLDGRKVVVLPHLSNLLEIHALGLPSCSWGGVSPEAFHYKTTQGEVVQEKLPAKRC